MLWFSAGRIQPLERIRKAPGGLSDRNNFFIDRNGKKSNEYKDKKESPNVISRRITSLIYCWRFRNIIRFVLSWLSVTLFWLQGSLRIAFNIYNLSNNLCQIHTILFIEISFDYHTLSPTDVSYVGNHKSWDWNDRKSKWS